MQSSERPGLRQRLKQSRAFIFSLIAIATVWLVSSMSEQKAFREHYKLVLDGFDRAQYAVTAIDTVMTLDVTSNGFYAFRRGMEHRTIHIDVAKEIARTQNDDIQLVLATEDYIDIIRRQIDTRGVSETKPVGSVIRLSLAQRQKKAFAPDISNISFQFDAMVGLCGEPRIEPDTVYLYGSRSSLDKIERVCAEPQTIKNIHTASKHRVKLSTDWDKYPDIHASTETVNIFVPVEPFTEKAVRVPVTYTSDNSYKRIQLYPSYVTVHCLVPSREYGDIDSSDFVVSARVTDDSSKYLLPSVTRFPANIRVKNIAPQQLQYIIIK